MMGLKARSRIAENADGTGSVAVFGGVGRQIAKAGINCGVDVKADIQG